MWGFRYIHVVCSESRSFYYDFKPEYAVLERIRSAAIRRPHYLRSELQTHFNKGGTQIENGFTLDNVLSGAPHPPTPRV